MEEELMMLGPKDHTHIVKGKRTKRQRPHSPIPLFTIPTTNSSTASGDDGDDEGRVVDDDHVGPSPTEEEEDMANCLILLAQGHTRLPWTTTAATTQDYQHHPHSHHDHETNKFSSKKYVETSNGKVGFYVYECKTCSRTFPSFQALGGHRASHKKPKAVAAAAAMMAENRNKMLLALSDDDDNDDEDELVMMRKREANSLSLQLMSNRPMVYGPTNNKFKVHECAICGAEFSSGQALGGHMRRHRSANTALSLSPVDTTITSFEMTTMEANSVKRSKNVLSLDLNLPAPQEDHDQNQNQNQNLRETKFGFLGKQQQKQKQQQQQEPLVLSTPHTLVDCHY